MPIARILAVMVLVAIAITFYFASNRESSTANREMEISNSDADQAEEVYSADIEVVGMETDIGDSGNAAAQISLARSIFEFDKDFRNEAIAEVEKAVTANFGIDKGISQYEAVFIDPGDIVVGDLSEAGAIAKEFHLAFLNNVSYLVSEVEYRPLDTNNQATWRGTANGQNSGTIEMTINAGEEQVPTLSIRIDVPPRMFLLFALDDLPKIYVAAEVNVAHQRALNSR